MWWKLNVNYLNIRGFCGSECGNSDHIGWKCTVCVYVYVGGMSRLQVVVARLGLRKVKEILLECRLKTPFTERRQWPIPWSWMEREYLSECHVLGMSLRFSKYVPREDYWKGSCSRKQSCCVGFQKRLLANEDCKMGDGGWGACKWWTHQPWLWFMNRI